MNSPSLTIDQQTAKEIFELHLSLLENSEYLKQSLKKLATNVPNNYDLGEIIREIALK
jgi:hypothetical protein